MLYDVIIIGGGPAAVAAAVYTARKKLKTLLITESLGGQSIVSDDIQNWIGEKHISGFDLAKKLEEHVRAYPDMVEIKMPEKAVEVKTFRCLNGARVCDFEVKTDKDGAYQGKTVILAPGARRRRLGVKGEDKFDGKGVAYCSTCLPPEESIVANSSVRNVTEIQPQQSVLTLDGSFRAVTDVMSRAYKGELIEIRTRFFSEPVQLTPNHPVLATTVIKGKAKNYWRDFKINQSNWLRADDLTTNHVLLYPVISTVKDVEYIKLSKLLKIPGMDGTVGYKRKSPTSIRLPDEIPVDRDFMRLAGYFIAEGSITDKGINFYFSKYEMGLIKDIQNLIDGIFGLKPRLREEGNVKRMEVYSDLIRDSFQILFGKYAHGKKLPHWMVLLPEHKLVELVRGIFRGDGCKRDKDFCIVSNSRQLIYQLRDILLKLGAIPAIQRRSVAALNMKPGKIGGRIIKFNHDKYHIIVGGPSLERMSEILGVCHGKISTRKQVCHHAWLDKNYLYLPVRSIKKVLYEGKVYNLAVEKNNTYVAKNFIVHNCDAPLFSGKRVAVIGGGNAGLEAVQDLFPYASEIYLFEYGEALKGDPVTQEEIKKNPKLKQVILNAQTLEILGDKFVTGLKYKDKKSGEEKVLELNGVFVEIGSIPNSEMVKGLVELDKWGQVIIDSKHATTSHPGIFAAGDITDDPYKQNNISAGDAVKAALAAYAYLLRRPGFKPESG